MMKHAYLIIAHDNFEQLKHLIDSLDDLRNDIYIHIDKKAKKFSQDIFNTKYSKVILLDRKNVTWGGYSQVDCELRLLGYAVKSPTSYSYYHLLSGRDLPIKNQNYIHDFFKKNNGKEFISIKTSLDQGDYDKANYYWLFQDFIGRKRDFINQSIRYLQHIIYYMQKCLRFERKHSINIYKGANWFSITDDLATYIISNEEFIKKEFNYCYCVDEFFLQSVTMASEYSKNIINDSLREIDWDRGKPYIYTKEDFDMLINSDKLFARKFDANKDNDIIVKILDYINK